MIDSDTDVVLAPTALIFGAVGLTWRRRPAGIQKALVPGGFTLTALSCAAVAAVGEVLQDGGDGGLWLYLAFIGVGAGLALAFSPTLTGALATVRQEDAADASGLLVTVTQLGQLIGVAAFGTLFLNRQTVPGALESAEAL